MSVNGNALESRVLSLSSTDGLLSLTVLLVTRYILRPSYGQDTVVRACVDTSCEMFVARSRMC